MSSKIIFLSRSNFFILAFFLFALPRVSVAQIPVTDIAGINVTIANQVESISKWTTQFNQIKTQITQYQEQIGQLKAQYEAVTGPRGMAALLDNKTLQAALPADFKSVLGVIKTSASFKLERGKFPTLPTFPKTNAMYDVVAAQNSVMSDLFAKANSQVALIKSLTASIDSANDPAAKVDLTNRMISETNAMQANQNLVTLLQANQKQELEVATREAVKEYTCKEFKRSSC